MRVADDESVTETDTRTDPGTRTVLGTCHHDCPDACGWVVTVTDGVATRLRGDPDHPYSAGELCPKVNRLLDRVYSPDRITTPLLRTGPKGEGRFEPASWDRALDVVATAIAAAIDRHGGETVYSWSDAGNQSALSFDSMSHRFLTRIGASRMTDTLCGAVAREGVAATNGSGDSMDPLDLRHSRLILLWGTNTRLTNRHLWPTIEAARSDGATVVVIDPIRTSTATAADRHVQPLPGTDVALMLSMMHVLVRDDLVDHDYLERHTVGFDHLVGRVADWPPERAARVCGLTVDEVEWLARAYGTIRPAAIRTLIGAEHRTNGAMLFRTMACLPLLVGAWRDVGGGLARSTGGWTGAALDQFALWGPNLGDGRIPRGLSMNQLGRHLTDPNLDPPVDVLLAWNGNPLVSVPNSELTRRGLERDDLFTVVHEQFMTDTARYADVVLPATTQIEQLDVVASWGSLYLGVNHPAIPPVGDSVSNTELFRRLAAAMGFAEPGFTDTDEDLLAAALGHLSGTEREALHRDGHLRVDVADPLLHFADGGFPTPSGRAELYSEALAAVGQDPLPAYVAALEGPGGDPDLVARHPLVLLTPKTHTRFLNTSYSHLPGHGDREGGNRAELDAFDADERGVSDGDRVRVFNDRGAIELTVRVVDRLRPGVVAIPFGWWDRDAGGRSANSLTNDDLTDWGGGSAFFDTLVQVERVEP